MSSQKFDFPMVIPLQSDSLKAGCIQCTSLTLSKDISSTMSSMKMKNRILWTKRRGHNGDSAKTLLFILPKLQLGVSARRLFS
jgi:hypothetical protein